MKGWTAPCILRAFVTRSASMAVRAMPLMEPEEGCKALAVESPHEKEDDRREEGDHDEGRRYGRPEPMSQAGRSSLRMTAMVKTKESAALTPTQPPKKKRTAKKRRARPARMSSLKWSITLA